MKILARFYYLPFVIGIIISIVIWAIGSFDPKLKAEGFAKLQYNHILTDPVSNIYWEVNLKKIVEKFNNQKVELINKRGALRFFSKDGDIEEIKKSYQNVKNEFQKYKAQYLKYQRARIKEEIDDRWFKKKKYKLEKFKSSAEYIASLEKEKFLADLKTNEIIIREYQIINITLLITFLLSVILYNIKKFFK